LANQTTERTKSLAVSAALTGAANKTLLTVTLSEMLPQSVAD